MKKLQLKSVKYSQRTGQECRMDSPNVTEDVLFMQDNLVIGFYLKSVSKEFDELSEYCNQEFLSHRVPKSDMRRSSGLFDHEKEVMQYSTILGYVPPKPHMKRNYSNFSSVHRKKQASGFIIGMIKLAQLCEKKIQEISPALWRQHEEGVLAQADKRFMLSESYTSSISNFNISARYHVDTGNCQGSVNSIVTKRRNATGGYLHIPEYGACIEQSDNSLLVYPAWLNMHGVTPIVKTHPTGYRNSLIFYSLRGSHQAQKGK
jgi:hypothetical protein